MKVNLKRYKLITLGLIAVLMLAVHPVESKESVKEIEDTEEVRLYFQDGKHVKQKPKSRNEGRKGFLSIEQAFADDAGRQIPTFHRYIFYCNLIYYQ